MTFMVMQEMHAVHIVYTRLLRSYTHIMHKRARTCIYNATNLSSSTLKRMVRYNDVDYLQSLNKDELLSQLMDDVGLDQSCALHFYLALH